MIGVNAVCTYCCCLCEDILAAQIWTSKCCNYSYQEVEYSNNNCLHRTYCRTQMTRWKTRQRDTLKMRREKGTCCLPSLPKSASVPWCFISFWVKQYINKYESIFKTYRAHVCYQDCKWEFTCGFTFRVILLYSSLASFALIFSRRATSWGFCWV